MVTTSKKNSMGQVTKGGGFGRLIRRLSHGILSFGVIYYFLPEPMPIGQLPRWSILIAAVLIVVIVESWRFRSGRLFFGMRPYESRRIASYLYAVLGVAFVLAIAPIEIGAPSIIAMAWTDPIAGEIRHTTRSEVTTIAIAALSYSLIAFLLLILLNVSLPAAIILVLIMMPIAVASESIDIKWLDDDFTMLVFPAIPATLLVCAASLV